MTASADTPPPDSRKTSGPPPPQTAPPGEAPYERRDAMRRITIAWMFGAAWMHMTSGLALTKFARGLGLPLFWFGVLGALPFIGAFTALPASYAIARFGHRKRLFMIAGICHRALWVPIALIPWVLPNAWWWPALLVLRALSSLGGYVMSPAVLSWFADVIPARVRGRFFSRWTLAGRATGVLATLAVAYLLDLVEPSGALMLRRAVSVVFAVATVFGVVDFLWLVPIPDVEHRPDPKISFWGLMRGPLSDRDFRCFLGLTFTRTLAIGFLEQYLWLYLFEALGLSNWQANLWLVAIPAVVAVVVLPVWGRLIDRLGCKPVLILAGLLVVPGSAAWSLVTPGHWWPGYIGVLVSVAAWPGLELASFNLLLGMSGSQKGQRQGSAFIAVTGLVAAAAAAFSGLLGGSVANWLGKGWTGSFLGWPLTYHGVLFFLSGALRLAALAWLFGLREPRARGARETAQYVFGVMRSALLRPLRWLGR